MVNNDKKIEKENENKDLDLLLNDFIKNGIVEKTKLIVPGFKVRLKVLDTGELLTAEAFMDMSVAPKDIVARVRAASILSQAIISINDVDIIPEGFDSQNYIISRKRDLYQKLLKMPAMVVQKTYEFYIECVKEQNDKYEDLEGTIEDIKNFS